MKKLLLIVVLLSYCQINSQEWITWDRFPRFVSLDFDNKYNSENFDTHPYSFASGAIRKLDKRDFKGLADLVMRGFVTLWYKSRPAFSTIRENYEIAFFPTCSDEVEFEFTTGENSRTIASAHSPLQGNIKFIINIDKWEKLNNYQRVWLFTHELGHEFFGLKHGTSKMMYPIMPEDDLTVDFYLLYDDAKKTIPKDQLWRAIEKLDEFTFYKHWENETRNSLYFGRGFDEDKMGVLSQRSISPAFATLWVAVEEMFDEVFDDIKWQIEKDYQEKEGVDVSKIILDPKFNYNILKSEYNGVTTYNIRCD